MWLYIIVWIIAFIPFRLFYPTKIYGSTKLKKGSSVIVCNHLSGWDITILATRFRKHLIFMAKKELFKNFILRWAFNTVKVIPVERDGKDTSTIKNTLKSLKEGRTLCMFPEGTRNRGDITQMAPLKSGAALFAIKSKVAITPVILRYAPRPFKKNYMIIGESFELSEFYDKKLNNDVIDAATQVLEEKMFVLQKELLEKTEKKR